MIIPPDLEDRFLPPEGWREGVFSSHGHRLVYGFVIPPKTMSAVIIMPGRSEFREKYFETIRDLVQRGHAVFIMDWYGQGGSERLPGNPQKDWDIPYEIHIADFGAFIDQIVRPGLPPGTPLYMLAHSMGGNVGLRYLIGHPGVFDAAAFSAPMLGLRAVRHLPYSLSIAVARLFPPGRYIFWGGGEWREGCRGLPGTDIFSTDPIRDTVHMAWMQANPNLRLGEVTFGWIKNALTSCRAVFQDSVLKRIDIPCLFAIATEEALVDNIAIERAARLIPEAQLLSLPGARHEILMERDTHRNAFLNGFDNLVSRVKMTPA